MTKLACNYLKEAEELLKEKKVDFDYFKYPSLGGDSSFQSLDSFHNRLQDIRNTKTLLYHGLYPNMVNICNGNFKENFDIEAFRKVCSITETPGISFHITGAEVDDSRVEIIRNAVENIIYIKEEFKDMEFITFENSMGNCNQYQLDPEIINEPE